MLFIRLKRALVSLAAVGICLAVVLGVYVMNACKLRMLSGERTFYLDSSSSQGLRKESISLIDLPRVRGESVRFSCQEDEVLSIIRACGGKVEFVEEVCGITSYYCTTDEWESGILLNGKKINLHIAFSNGQCVVGVPIIFDGF